jgi:hypothetical protein
MFIGVNVRLCYDESGVAVMQAPMHNELDAV